jgi:outer membrane protein assembly factor BamB
MNRSLPIRRVALGAAVGGVAVALAAAFALTSGGGDAGAERPAGSPTTSVPSAAARSGPARWSIESTGGEPMGVTLDADGVIAVSYQSVQSIDPSDGSQRWHTAIGRTPDIAPVRAAADHDVVAVPTGEGVTALARTDGAVRWSSRFGTGLEMAGLSGTVAVAHPAGAPPLVLGTKAGTVAAFDAGSGTVRWKVRFDGDIVTAPAIDDGTGTAVVLWHPDRGEGRLRAIDLVTGAIRWEAATLEKTAAPVVHGGAVLVSEGDNFSRARARALDLGTGAVRWESALPKSFEWETEPAAAGADYVTVDHFGTVTALEAASGRIRWQRSGDWALLDTQVVIGERSVAFHDFNGHLVTLDRATGSLRSVRLQPDVTDSAGRDGLLVTAVNQLVARRFEARELGSHSGRKG